MSFIKESCKIFPISVYLMVRPTQQPQHNMTLPRVLGGPSDCQSATVAAREGLAASESWHIIVYMVL